MSTNRASRLADRLEALMNAHAARQYRHDLRPTQWQALRFFAGHPGSTITEFARARRSSTGSASVLVKRLVERGLVARTGGRNVSLQLTHAGWDVLRHDPRSDLEQGLAELTDPGGG
ncbi:MarR family winged helix-turn-helix transcriptional regulator [Rhodovibrio sodomensis]|nr:MarR family transcriptional regulator [Rhodovibrio sodomensis]